MIAEICPMIKHVFRPDDTGRASSRGIIQFAPFVNYTQHLAVYCPHFWSCWTSVRWFRYDDNFFHLYLCEYSKIDNGDLRVYDLSSFKVLRAVKGNGNMISSIVCVKRSGSDFRDAWVASGKQVCTCFSSQSIFGRDSFPSDLSLSTGYTKSDTDL